jgi:hypothetical protein
MESNTKVVMVSGKIVKKAMRQMSRGKKIRKKLGRIPLPRKRSGPQTTKKGKKGYDRKREKERIFPLLQIPTSGKKQR